MLDYTVRPISDRTMFTGRHRVSQFASSWSSTEEVLERELRQLRARNVVLEMDVREDDIRVDGRIRANARPSTPAVRLAFDSSQGPLIYATDRFWTWQDNVRGIALGLEALRKIERYGIANRDEQYTGFKQLGAGRAMPASHMTGDAARSTLATIVGVPLIENAGDADALPRFFRQARAIAHPDRHDGARELWDKVEEAGKVLGLVS